LTNASAVANVPMEELVGKITDEFLERLDRGEQPQVEDYARRYPEAAAVIRQVFPALMVILGPAQGIAPLDERADMVHPAGCLGDFRIVREIGRGGMGVVYEAQQISLCRPVALKVLPLAAALDAKQLQRFQLEAQAAACVHHTSIVPVHAVGCERGVAFYAMEYIEGCSLAQLIAELRRLDVQGGAREPHQELVGISTSTLATGLLLGRISRTGGPEVSAEPGPEAHAFFSAVSPRNSDHAATAPTKTQSSLHSSGPSTRSRAYVRAVA
jgi:serine/threonine-protein kinase